MSESYAVVVTVNGKVERCKVFPSQWQAEEHAVETCKVNGIEYNYPEAVDDCRSAFSVTVIVCK